MGLAYKGLTYKDMPTEKNKIKHQLLQIFENFAEETKNLIFEVINYLKLIHE